MNKRARLQTTVAVAVLFLCSCANGKKELLPTVTNTGNESNPQTSIAELQRLNQSARSEQDRRAVCLRAIDERVIYSDGPISNVDQIFETHFASELPAEGQVQKGMPVLFATQLSPVPRPDGRAEAVPYIGSYFAVEYDHAGKVRYYYLSNLHKGMSGPIMGREPISVAELKRRYSEAKSESERRDVALKAIDDGVIRTFGPVPVSVVDEIFGTQLASQLPTRREMTRTGIVSFAASDAGWFLGVEYTTEGHIYSYYLSNIQK